MTQVGFYVTVKRGARVGWLGGPFTSHDEADRNVAPLRRQAEDVDPFCAFDAFGVTRVERETDKPLPLGVLTRHNMERAAA